MAVGVTADGRRQILGVSVSLGEQEVHWRAFLQNLVKRGLQGVQFVISDDHAGLKAARIAVFGGTPWQRCQFHLQQNASAYVPRQSMKAEVAADCICQAKRGPFDNRKGDHLDLLVKNLTIEKGPF